MSESTDVSSIAAQAVDGVGPPADLDMDDHERAAFSEWLHTDGYQIAALAAQQHVKRQADRGFKANNGHTLGRAKRALIAAVKRGEWLAGYEIGGDEAMGILSSLPAPDTHPPMRSSGHGGDAYNVDARDWWDTVKGGLSDECYNACVLAFGLDGHDELGIEGAAERLGVHRSTVYEWVGRAGGARGACDHSIVPRANNCDF